MIPHTSSYCCLLVTLPPMLCFLPRSLRDVMFSRNNPPDILFSSKDSPDVIFSRNHSPDIFFFSKDSPDVVFSCTDSTSPCIFINTSEVYPCKLVAMHND